MPLPTYEDLERFYPKEEVEVLDKVRRTIGGMSDSDGGKKRSAFGRRMLAAIWPDQLTRIGKTYFIQTKEHGLQLLKPNYAQVRFYQDVIVRCRKEGRPVRGRILKARQLGFSTFIQAFHFDECDQNPNRNAMTVSYDEDSTEELHQKSKVIRDRLWFSRSFRRDRSGVLEWDQPHGSTIYTKTAGNTSVGRSLTLHHLHCSEIPMWPDAEPALLSVHQSVPARPFTSIFWESTAKGASGEFYDGWTKSEAGEDDFVPFFAPWFWDPEYKLDFPTPRARQVFLDQQSIEDQEVMKRFGLSAEQMAWRAWKIRTDCGSSVPKFNQEFPACPEEAFLTSGSPAFQPRLVRALHDNVVAPLWTGDILLKQP